MIQLIVLILLLSLGYGVGSYRERKHYQSIRKREHKLKDILIFNGRYPASAKGGLGGDLVQGNVVVSADYFKVFVASLHKLVGGHLKSYETLLDRGRREAVLRMKTQARELGANQIFNVRYESASISKGERDRLSSVEVLVYGSAVKKTD